MWAASAELDATGPCYLVSDWCGEVDLRKWSTAEHRERVGIFDIPSAAVAKADRLIPAGYEEAEAKGQTHGCSSEDFRLAREFLAKAARIGSPITGIY